jgi:hypothetical protein
MPQTYRSSCAGFLGGADRGQSRLEQSWQDDEVWRAYYMGSSSASRPVLLAALVDTNSFWVITRERDDGT